MVVASDQYRGIVRITRAGFSDLARELFPAHVLDEPAIDGDPGRYWDEITALDVDPLFLLAMFEHESTFGRYGVARESKSWGNTRRPSFGVPDVGQIAGASGMFSEYETWLDGCISTAARLAARDWYYAGENRTIGEIFNDPIANDPSRRPAIEPVPRNRRDDGSIIRIEWAPSYDSNDPAGYLGAVLAFMTEHTDTEETGGLAPGSLLVCLSAGHFNTSGDGYGGDERRRVEPVALELYRQMQAAGINVRMLQGIGGDGRLLDFPGDHRAVGREAYRLWETGEHRWRLFLEVHLEGTHPDARGVFAIAPYNEERGDIDTDVLLDLGARVAQRIGQSTGLPLRSLGAPGGLGIMAESQTDVRELGVFSSTTGARGESERMLVEYGAFTNADDRAIIDGPGFAEQAARGTIEAIAGYYGIRLPEAPRPPAEDPEGRFFQETGVYLGGGFYRYWSSFGGVEIFGLPITSEIEVETLDGFRGTAQYFERARFEHHPGARPDRWDVLLGRVGAELLRAQGVANDLDEELARYHRLVRERDDRIRRLESEIRAYRRVVESG